MLLEGVPAPTIEQASSQAGYPAPVLQLSDELNMKLMRKIRNAAKDGRAGDRPAAGTRHPSEQVIDRMLDEFERPGRLEGAGFYEYEDGKRTRLWPGLRDAFPVTGDPSQIDAEGPRGADAHHRVPGDGQVPGRGRDRVRRRRQHRLDHGHRLPRLDRRRAPVHQRLRRRPAPASSPAPASWPSATASASSRRPRWWRRPSAARSTQTKRPSSPPEVFGGAHARPADGACAVGAGSHAHPAIPNPTPRPAAGTPRRRTRRPSRAAAGATWRRSR